MKLHNATVLITGANRGLGLAFAREALSRGARKVYAGARDPASVTLPGVEPIALDVNDPEQVAAAARPGNGGTLRVSQAFAPVLASHGGGAILNVLSIASWINPPMLSVYGASKSAAWALTNGLRNDLRAQGTQVLGLHMGFVDTDLTRGIDMPKSTPDEIVRRAFDALEAGADEVLADELTQQVKRGLSAEPGIYLRDARV